MTKNDMKAAQEMIGTMKNALIDLSQSDHVDTARRARSALFDAGVIDQDHDGGVAQCRSLWNRNWIRSLADDVVEDIAANPDDPMYGEAVVEKARRTTSK